MSDQAKIIPPPSLPPPKSCPLSLADAAKPPTLLFGQHPPEGFSSPGPFQERGGRPVTPPTGCPSVCFACPSPLQTGPLRAERQPDPIDYPKTFGATGKHLQLNPPLLGSVIPPPCFGRKGNRGTHQAFCLPCWGKQGGKCGLGVAAKPGSNSLVGPA